MAQRMPPVPPAGRSPKGTGGAPDPEQRADAPMPDHRPVPENLREQGRQGNIHQNTRNKGYQQDR